MGRWRGWSGLSAGGDSRYGDRLQFGVVVVRVHGVYDQLGVLGRVYDRLRILGVYGWLASARLLSFRAWGTIVRVYWIHVVGIHWIDDVVGIVWFAWIGNGHCSLTTGRPRIGRLDFDCLSGRDVRIVGIEARREHWHHRCHRRHRCRPHSGRHRCHRNRGRLRDEPRIRRHGHQWR